MATTNGLSIIYEIQNLTDTYLGKVTKFQGNGFLSSEPFTGPEVENTPVLLGLRRWG